MCPQFTKAEHQNIHSLVVYHWIWSTPCWIINVAFNSFIQNDAILDIDLQANDKIIPTVNRLTSKISFVILLTVCHKVLVMLVLRIKGSTNNPLTDIFLYSHHLSAWYCIDIVRRNSWLLMGVKGLNCNQDSYWERSLLQALIRIQLVPVT